MPGGLQQKHDPSGTTKPGELWGDGQDLWLEPGSDAEMQAAQAAREHDYAGIQAGSGSQAGVDFGNRMAGMVGNAPPHAVADYGQINMARGLESQSYGQQQQALGMMRAAAMGQGPSVAALQGQAGMDQAGRQMMASRGGPMTASMMSGAAQSAAANAGAARAQEIQQAQGAWGQGANAMRGQSLQGLQQAQQGGWRSTDLDLSQQQQDLERELALQRLSLGGYQAYTGQENDIRNIYGGVNRSEIDAQRAQMAGLMNMAGSGLGQGLSMIGAANRGGTGNKPPNGYG